VTSVKLTKGTLILSGSNLQNVTALKIRDMKNTSSLNILSQSATQITTAATSTLSLIVGAAYSLIISMAHADDLTIPVLVQVADGYFSPSVLSSGNASPGVVLKWNGTVWVPAPDLVGVGGNMLTFAGYTASTIAAMGGFKGANALCDSAFPGSHFASIDEIMRLGAKYPWTKEVWIRGIQTGDSVGNMGFDNNAGYGNTILKECRGWTGSGIGPMLYQTGTVFGESCANAHPIACVQ